MKAYVSNVATSKEVDVGSVSVNEIGDGRAWLYLYSDKGFVGVSVNKDEARRLGRALLEAAGPVEPLKKDVKISLSGKEF